MGNQILVWAVWLFCVLLITGVAVLVIKSINLYTSGATVEQSPKGLCRDCGSSGAHYRGCATSYRNSLSPADSMKVTRDALPTAERTWFDQQAALVGLRWSYKDNTYHQA